MSVSVIQPVVGTRWSHLDALRAFLMLVGIPYHAAMFVRADLPALDAAASFTNVWRMSTFFVVAGFFAVLVADRRGTGPWLRGRLRRLGIPLLFCVVVINPLQTWALLGGDLDRTVARMTASAWPWLHHAWFLLYLLVYCLALAAVRRLVARGPREGRTPAARLAGWLYADPWRLAFAALAVVPVAYGLTYAWVVADLQGATRGAFTPLVLVHAVSFGAGALLAVGGGHVERVAQAARGPVVVAALAGAVWILLEPTPLAPDLTPDTARALHLAVLGGAGLAWAALLLRWFAARFSREHPVVRWLVSASLPVYLLHLPVVFAVGPVLRDHGVDGWTGWLVLTVVATVLPFAGYEAAARVRPARLLLTGDGARGVVLADVLRDLRAGRDVSR